VAKLKDKKLIPFPSESLDNFRTGFSKEEKN